MNEVNRFGLRRRPESSVRRTIRKNSGFGCVVCGLAIGDYEHVDPTYVDAEIHDPNCMTFLCIRCHGKVTRGQLSKESVKDAMREPAAFKAGFSFEALDVGSSAPTIHIGPMSVKNCESIISVNSRPVLWIHPPEEAGGPVRIGAEIRNEHGELVFSIVDNEWRVQKESWDVEVIGKTTTIRNGPREIALVIRTEPPGDLYIDRMDMSIEGYRFWIDSGNLYIRRPDGQTDSVQRFDFVDCTAAIVAVNNTLIFGTGGGRVSFSLAGKGRTSRVIDTSRRRNSVCACGSGKRFKHCCGAF
ncbi:MAG: SEC-C domain-containing protein [Rhodobacter sp.]|nr:SEC-C domain-containing protein [Paracoccaceae bacterium]MCC0073598.1 SEC-C domain-containing protein [Rhodobacter sp.]